MKEIITTADLQDLTKVKQELAYEAQSVDEEEEEFFRKLGILGEDKEMIYAKKSFENAIAFLDDMVGMEEIKEKLLRLGRYVQWKNALASRGNDVSCYPTPNLTFFFMGDPGTGKTTLAGKMGEVLYSLDLIERPQVFFYKREDLVGENYGAEEKHTKEALEQARGGVLVLDEAYQCFKGANDKRDPGYHILETLMAEFDKPGRCIILAGYKKEMLDLMQVNSGFKSRIPKENLFEFSGPSEARLFEIVKRRLNKMEMRMSPKAAQLLRKSIHEQLNHKDQSFGNARQMQQMTDAMVIAHANRIMGMAIRYDNLVINSADMNTCLSAQTQQNQPTRSRIGFA